jgi:hypothetical protein
MELLDKYLAALEKLLPRETGADILREIADEIQSQMEEKADALGHPLTGDEQSEVIRRHGHPMIVAARYGRERRLIGPALFPIYWQTLRISILVALAVWTVIIAAALMSSPDPARAWAPLVLRVPGVLITIFGVITALFAVAELVGPCAGPNLHARWDPRSLPDPRPSGERAEAVVGLLAGVIGLAWWVVVPSMPFLAFGPAASFLTLGPSWQQLYWPVLILIAANVGRSALCIWWSDRHAWQARTGMALDAAEIGILLLALRSAGWVAVQPGVPGGYAAAAEALNRILGAGSAVGMLVRTVQFVFKYFHYRRHFWPITELQSFRPFHNRSAK